MTDNKKINHSIALDHMTVAHIEGKLEKSLTVAHLTRPIEQTPPQTQSGSNTSSGSNSGNQQKPASKNE
jgi:hypothetical protein